MGDVESGGGGGGGSGQNYARIPGGGGGGPGGAPGGGPPDPAAQEASALFGVLTGQSGAGADPRKESYWDMWKFAFCPTFSPYSFIFLIWIMNTAAFLVSLIMTVIKYDDLNPLVFLGPNLHVLNQLGCLNPYEARINWQVWRLFTSLFLSTGLSNYVISSILLFFIGFMVESAKVGIAKMAAFYFICGGVAGLFSILVSDELSCGNYAACMALVSCLLGLLIRNWKPLAGAGPMRICLIFIIVLIFVVVLMMTASSASPGAQFQGIDLAGEGGGFMAGLWLGMVLMPAVRHGAENPGSYEKLVQKIGGGVFFIYTVILLCLFFWVANPSINIYV